ncbi:E3 ubiquitin-protein ligase [Salix suchowensis]|nr:E3 ubiquitin-protein ligase [Salix suchowensis]
MELLGSMWCYEESMDELKQKLVQATIELESLKVEAREEMRKHREDVEHLTNLLKIASQEGDEAKSQLQSLLNKLALSKSMAASLPIHLQEQSENPIVVSVMGNSSITESNSLSDTCNHQSHGSSPVDPLFDTITSPDFSNINSADLSEAGFVSNTFFQDYRGSISAGLVPPAEAKIHPADALIDNFVKGKVLPQKRKLLQALMEAGPLLQTLLIAGPLPRWRNSPPLQPLNILPVSMSNQNTFANSLAQNPLASPSFIELRRLSSQKCSSMLNFDSAGSSSGLDKGYLLNSGAIHQIPAAKRQRFQ